MKTTIILLTGILMNFNSFSQKKLDKNNFLKLTAGHINFGTGDIPGYAANVEYSRHLNGENNFGKHIALGAELSFENGSTQPTIFNPTLQEFLFGIIYQTTTNIALTPKVTYYPINKTFLKGINITGGLSIAYSSYTDEFQATRFYDSIGQRFVRRSYLEFHNVVTLGYRITAGYEWFFKRLIIGARLDFNSYHNGDINTFYGLKAGYRF